MMTAATTSRLLALMCIGLPIAKSFTPSSVAPTLRQAASATSSCTMSASGSKSSRRSFLAIGGAGLLAGVGADRASAASFEDFMAEKRREEARKEAKKSGGSAFGVDSNDDGPVGDVAPVSSGAPSKSAIDDYKDLKPVVDEDPVKTVFVTILRVQEATLQEERLIKTGQFKDLQRNNIKLATKMILENYGINDAITKASGYAVKKNQVSDANNIGREAINDLRIIIDYFDELNNASNLKVNELSGDKKDFLVKALQASRQKFDTFLSYMPSDKVSAARKQVIEENELNKKELPSDMTILNPIFMN